MRRTADFLKRTDPVPRLFKPAFLSILSPGALLEHSSCMRGERRLRPCCDMQRQVCGSPAGFRARRRGYAGAIRQLPGPFTNRSRASTASSVTFLAAPMSICTCPRNASGRSAPYRWFRLPGSASRPSPDRDSGHDAGQRLAPLARWRPPHPVFAHKAVGPPRQISSGRPPSRIGWQGAA